jgi:hypothetical protein
MFSGIQNVASVWGLPDFESLKRRVSNRRQGGPSAASGALTLASNAVDAASRLVSNIPVDKVMQ